MGDRTYAYYKIHPEDIAAACELNLCNIDPSEDYADFGGEVAPDCGLRHLDEVNYGGGIDWDDMAEAGIRFYGWHGEGGEYGPVDFYSDGDGSIVYYDAGTNSGYVVYPNANGELDPKEIKALEDFVRNNFAAQKLIDEAWSLLPFNMAAKLYAYTCDQCENTHTDEFQTLCESCRETDEETP